MTTQVVAVSFATVIFFLIAEFFGRSKHIGRWWSFGLLMGCILPGIIAMVLSPSAKVNPTKGTVAHFIGGGVFFIFGIGNIIPVLSDIESVSNLGFSIGISISFFITAAYLIALGAGEIINNDPKYYFENMGVSITSLPIGQNINKIITDIPKETESKNTNVYLYYIIENNQSSEPLTLNQLKDKKIKEDTLVCRNGQKGWVKAIDIKELQGIIIFAPPPIPNIINEDEKLEQIDSNILKLVSNDIFSFNNRTYTIDELAVELEQGNYFVGKDSMVQLTNSDTIKLKSMKQFDKLRQFFPPDVNV